MSPSMENAPPSPVDGEQVSSEASTPSVEQPTPTFDATTQMVDVDGEQMTVANLSKSYKHSRTEMSRAQQEANDSRGYKQKAEEWDQFGVALENDPGFRSHIDNYLEGRTEHEVAVQQRPTILDQNAQKFQNMEQQVEAMRIDRDITNLEQKGYDVSGDRRNEMLQYMGRNPGIKDADIAYKTLYFDDAVKAASEKAGLAAADKAAANSSAYPSPPTGVQSGGKEFGDLSDEDKDNVLLNDISNSDLSNLGG